MEEELWQVNFLNFVTGLGLECLVALGKLENPLTKEKKVDSRQARYIIDTLDMIKGKTKGNLNQEEEKSLDELIVYLKMLYLENSQGKKENKDVR